MQPKKEIASTRLNPLLRQIVTEKVKTPVKKTENKLCNCWLNSISCFVLLFNLQGFIFQYHVFPIVLF